MLKKDTTFLTHLKRATHRINPLVQVIDDFDSHLLAGDVDFIPYNKLKDYHPGDVDMHGRILITHVRGEIGRIDTSGGRNQTLDLRGFGETAANNVVILLDGVRQNEGDSGSANLAWIPLSSIERIEIVRGSGAVLHGDGATAGVINVITQKGLVDLIS